MWGEIFNAIMFYGIRVGGVLFLIFVFGFMAAVLWVLPDLSRSRDEMSEHYQRKLEGLIREARDRCGKPL